MQRCIVIASRLWHERRRVGQDVSWVVGVNEVASIVANVARAIPDSYSVSLTAHRFYDFEYDFQLTPRRGDWIRSRFVVPWRFGQLVVAARGFVYVGADGFLLGGVDDREWEFRFVKKHGRRIVCLFAGSDIRSPVLMRRFQAETGLETIVTYLDQVSSVFASAAYDEQRKRTAHVADEYADMVFTAAVDQLSYLTRPTQPFPYFFPNDELLDDMAKHAKPGPRIIVHAPSSPIIKGTQVVRAAVRRLASEGYEFDYRELIDVPHSEVLAALREAHIVLNEFYAFVPGVFGVEAMGSGCALLTSADETIEIDLPPDSNKAWLVTTAADIYANLRTLLDSPELIERQAVAGLNWVQEHATVSASGERIRALLDNLSR